ncbi:hypothetical protein DID88_005169 [Monilinia fructigena]|uniref:Uncharacterized protein n=1 Tax=Monilinia fructigena TaxID=38457 RepID=A0A395IDM0_9HELO|nr:hypothetical protein DID88_005169 [Monilinia fructigena]
MCPTARSEYVESIGQAISKSKENCFKDKNFLKTMSVLPGKILEQSVSLQTELDQGLLTLVGNSLVRAEEQLGTLRNKYMSYIRSESYPQIFYTMQFAVSAENPCTTRKSVDPMAFVEPSAAMSTITIASFGGSAKRVG